jgi:SprA-related family.
MIDPIQNIQYPYAYIPALTGQTVVSPSHSLEGVRGATNERKSVAPAEPVDSVEISTLYSKSNGAVRVPIMGSEATSNYPQPNQRDGRPQTTTTSGSESDNAVDTDELAETVEETEAGDNPESSSAQGSEKEAAASSGSDEEKAADGSDLSEEEQQQVKELKARDQEVRTHEQAHQAAGAGYAGGASYSYQRGPDGNNYAIGGEVSIDTSSTGDPERDIVKMRIVRAAALAPAEPSGQDLSVAAAASQREAEASRQASEQRMEESQQKRDEAAAAAEEQDAELAGEDGSTENASATASPAPPAESATDAQAANSGAGASASGEAGADVSALSSNSPNAYDPDAVGANSSASTNQPYSPGATANGQVESSDERVNIDRPEIELQARSENDQDSAVGRQARAAYGQASNLGRRIGIDLVA